MEEKSKVNTKDNLFYDVASYVVNEQELSIEVLKTKFNIDDKCVALLVNQMESEGIVSNLLDNNTRDVLMTDEEFSIIFNYKKTDIAKEQAAENTEQVKENTTPVNEGKHIFPLFVRFLLLLLLSILVFYFLIGFLLRRSKVSVTTIKQGWVQNGNNWNYYDLNGNKMFNCLIDDGGQYYYLDDNGNMASERWVEFNGKTFYVDKDGVMQKNKWVGDFYVGDDGNLLKNTTTPDGYQVGSDGRYIPKPKPTETPTQYTQPVLVIPETVMQNVIDDPAYTGYSVPNAVPENIIDRGYGTDIIAPTAATNVIDNIGASNSSKNNNYTIKSTNNYKEKDYLSNDRQCTVQILIPVLMDKDGVELEAFKEEIMQEQDNIISELIDIADSSIEDTSDDDYYSSYKYISSISFQEARIKTQDEYSLVIRETGKSQYNSGKSSKIILTIDYDKISGSVSYYIEE